MPTEDEKGAVFEAAGCDRKTLLRRIYSGAAGRAVRFFPLKLSIAWTLAERHWTRRPWRPAFVASLFS